MSDDTNDKMIPLQWAIQRTEKDLSILGEEPAQCRIFISAMIGGEKKVLLQKSSGIVHERQNFNAQIKKQIGEN